MTDEAWYIVRNTRGVTGFVGSGTDPIPLTEEEIRKEISTLDDKSLPNVMKHFKTNFQGKVDMGLVSKIARS